MNVTNFVYLMLYTITVIAISVYISYSIIKIEVYDPVYEEFTAKKISFVNDEGETVANIGQSEESNNFGLQLYDNEGNIRMFYGMLSGANPNIQMLSKIGNPVMYIYDNGITFKKYNEDGKINPLSIFGIHNQGGAMTFRSSSGNTIGLFATPNTSGILLKKNKQQVEFRIENNDDALIEIGDKDGKNKYRARVSPDGVLKKESAQ